MSFMFSDYLSAVPYRINGIVLWAIECIVASDDGDVATYTYCYCNTKKDAIDKIEKIKTGEE